MDVRRDGGTEGEIGDGGQGLGGAVVAGVDPGGEHGPLVDRRLAEIDAVRGEVSALPLRAVRHRDAVAAAVVPVRDDYEHVAVRLPVAEVAGDAGGRAAELRRVRDRGRAAGGEDRESV